jgi:hypothetical protein
MLVVLYAISAGSVFAQQTGVKITVRSAFLQFPATQMTKTAVRTFTVTNASTSPASATIHLTAPTTTSYSIIGTADSVLAPNGSWVVSVLFAPQAIGSLIDSIFVHHDGDTSLAKNPIRVIIFGTGKAAPGAADTNPKITVQPGQGGVNFGTLVVTKTLTRSITIYNVSDTQRTLVGLVDTTDPSSAFKVLTGAGAFAIDSGKSAVVQISFTPMVAGTFRDSIYVHSNADTLGSPNRLIKIILTGKAIASDTFPKVTVQQRQLTFPKDTVGMMIQRTLAVVNTSDSARVLIVNFTLPKPPFAVDSALATMIDSGKVHTVLIKFTPVAAGVFTDSLIVLTNAVAPSNRIVVTLNGTGVAAATGGVRVIQPEQLAFDIHPNPIATLTALSFELAQSINGKLTIFDALGKQLSVLANGKLSAGQHTYNWSADGLPNGTYFARLELEGLGVSTSRIVVSR